MTIAERQQAVTFRLGEDLFAADIYSVERVLKHQPPTPVPNVPEWIEGVMDYRGKVVPVLNLSRRFELSPSPVGKDTRILVFNAGNDWVAGVVDAVMEVTTLDPKQVAPPPPLFRGLAGEYLRGIVRTGKRLVIYLDVARLLSTTERLHLEVADTEAARA